jgi:hypothetical protein
LILLIITLEQEAQATARTVTRERPSVDQVFERAAIRWLRADLRDPVCRAWLA